MFKFLMFNMFKKKQSLDEKVKAGIKASEMVTKEIADSCVEYKILNCFELGNL